MKSEFTNPRKRPKTTHGQTYKVVTGCGNLYITVNRDIHGICEVFALLGKSGQCGAAQNEAICRAISIGLRANVDPSSFVRQLKGIMCPSTAVSDSVEIVSCADAIAKVLEMEITVEDK